METSKMKMVLKFVGIALFVGLILSSLAFNVYGVWKSVELKMQQQGVNIAIGQIVQTIESQGELKLNTEKGEIILIKKLDDAKK